MDKKTGAKLEMALITPDGIEAWNHVVRTYGLVFTLSYLDHTPVLYVGTKESRAEPWLTANTQQLHIHKWPIRNEQVFKGLRELEQRLEELGMVVTLQYKRNSQKQRFISLRFVPLTHTGLTVVLDVIKKGQSRKYEEFALNNRW